MRIETWIPGGGKLTSQSRYKKSIEPSNAIPNSRFMSEIKQEYCIEFLDVDRLGPDKPGRHEGLGGNSAENACMRAANDGV